MPVKKILCPTDFSEAANNAVEYAARFAKKTVSALTLMHVEPSPAFLLEDMNRSLASSYERTLEEKSKQLQDQCDEIIKTFEIACNYDLNQSNLENAIALKTAGANAYNLIVIGTNGIDNLGQLYFGTNSYLVAKEAQCPTLIIPEGCEYKDMTEIVFAYDYHKGDKLLLDQLNDFLNLFNSHLYILHIGSNNTPGRQEDYNAFCSLSNESLAHGRNIEFQWVVNENEIDGINSFIGKTTFDVLALSINQHGFLYRLFHEDIAKKITSVSNHPVFIFHK